MNCFLCARLGDERAAVGLCRHCQVALCMERLIESRDHNQGGMHWSCSHELPSKARPVASR